MVAGVDVQSLDGASAGAVPVKRRKSRISSAHASSGGCSARIRRRSAPRPRRTGPVVAAVCPRRTIVNVLQRCSTASKRSAKRLDAFVALISAIRSIIESRPKVARGVLTMGATLRHDGDAPSSNVPSRSRTPLARS